MALTNATGPITPPTPSHLRCSMALSSCTGRVSSFGARCIAVEKGAHLQKHSLRMRAEDGVGGSWYLHDGRVRDLSHQPVTDSALFSQVPLKAAVSESAVSGVHCGVHREHIARGSRGGKQGEHRLPNSGIGKQRHALTHRGGNGIPKTPGNHR